jgi:DNA-binding NarL/FixJ family response regulator
MTEYRPASRLQTHNRGILLSASPITVLVVDDHTVVREGIKAMLEAAPDIEVIGEAEDGKEAVELVQKLRPSITVMDVAMPHLNGLEAMRQMLKALPESRIILLSAHSDSAYIERAQDLGAKGYLLKRTSLSGLANAIRTVQQGGTVFMDPVVEKSGDNPPFPRASKEKNPPLTAREKEVLRLVAEGRTNKQIAENLNLSAKTIDKHRQSLMDKLNIHDTAGLTRYALFKGIVGDDVPTTIL